MSFKAGRSSNVHTTQDIITRATKNKKMKKNPQKLISNWEVEAQKRANEIALEFIQCKMEKKAASE